MEFKSQKFPQIEGPGVTLMDRHVRWSLGEEIGTRVGPIFIDTFFCEWSWWRELGRVSRAPGPWSPGSRSALVRTEQ